MRVHPYTQAKFLPHKDLQLFEYSDRILVGKNVFETLQCKNGEVTLINLTNRIGQSIAGVVAGCHMEEETVYVPTWMFYSIDITDNILITIIDKVICHKITVRPHNNEFLSISDWNEQLGNGLKNYTSITENTVLPIIIAGTVQKFTIVGLYPFKHKTCILQIGGMLELNVVKSLELLKQEVTLKYLYNRSQNSMSKAFGCIGNKLGGVPITDNVTQRALLLEAAKFRNENKVLE